jgi:maltose phosphorylase
MKRQDSYLLIDPWKIVEEGFHPEKSRVSESLFSLANEYQGVRGFLEEGYSGDTLRGCYLNGVYEEHLLKEPLSYKGISKRICFMVNTVDWLFLRLELDGEQLDLARSRFTGFRRELDFRTGLLRRELVWRTQSGRELGLAFERLLSMRTNERALQRVSFRPLNFSGSVVVTLGLDFSMVHECYGERFWDVPRKLHDKNDVAVLGVSRGVGQQVFAGFRWSASAEARAESVEEERLAGVRIVLTLKQGREDRLEKRCILCAAKGPGAESAEYRGASPEAVWSRGTELLRAAGDESFDQTVEEDRLYWQRVWQRADIEIEGDEEAQQGIRFCIFQLQQTCRGAIEGANIGAKGLTGEAYNGNAFWDTEVYCLPFYLFSNPTAARALIEFRHATLPQALARAAELDCQGACFPVATIDGTESCTLWQHASLQLQPTTAVAYAIWHYALVTGDTELLYGKGVELLLQICRFLASRGQWSSRGGFGYYAVMGPDEFHMMVNNNCYTNVMARQVFLFTLDVLDDLDRKGDVPRVSLEERRTWRRMAENMIVPRDPSTGIYEQHEGFFGLPHVDVDAIPETDFPLYAHWSYDRIFRSDMIKQPDVLMLMLLYNQSFSAREKSANYDYYEPRCIHESSLSPSVHSILAAELGRHGDAFEMFRFATRIDLDNYNRNTAEGLHMTSIAAAWMNIVYGFGGLRSDTETLLLDPRIPEKWTLCKFHILYRGSVVAVEARHDRTIIMVVDGAPVSLSVGGVARRIDGTPLVLPAASCS